MLLQSLQRHGERTLMLTLIVLIAAGATFVSLNRSETHAATSFSHSFKEIVGSDVYTFKDVTPASGTQASANLGVWAVSDNGASLGNIGMKVNTTATASNYIQSGSVSLAAIGGVIAVVGGVLMGVAFAPGLFGTAATEVAAAGAMTAGAAEATAVELTGASLTSAGEAAIVNSDRFFSAASSFSSVP